MIKLGSYVIHFSLPFNLFGETYYYRIIDSKNRFILKNTASQPLSKISL